MPVKPLRQITPHCLCSVCLKSHFHERIFKENQTQCQTTYYGYGRTQTHLSYPPSIKSLEAKTRIERITDRPSKPPSNAARSSNLPGKGPVKRLRDGSNKHIKGLNCIEVSNLSISVCKDCISWLSR